MLQHRETLADWALAFGPEAFAPHDNHIVVREQEEELEQAIRQ